MTEKIKRLLLKEMTHLRSNITNGRCCLSDREAMQIIGYMAHEPMNAETASEYLGLRINRFLDMTSRGLMPAGRMRPDWNESVWYRDELNDYLIKLGERE